MYISPKRNSVTVSPEESILIACGIVQKPWAFVIPGETHGAIFVAEREEEIDRAVGSVGARDDQSIRVYHTKMPKAPKTKSASVA